MSAASTASAPGPPDYEPFDMTRTNLRALWAGAPSVFGLESLFRPLYGALAQQDLRNSLFGSPGRTSQMRVVTGYDNDGNPITKTVQRRIPQTPGLLGMLEKATPEVSRIYFGDQAGQREQLLSGLAGQAQEDLDLGYQLSPALRRELEQATLGDASMRGFGHSPLDAYMTYASMGSAAEQLRRQRQGFAGNVAGLLAAPRPEAVTAAGLLGAASPMSQSTGPRLFDPFRQFGQYTPGGSATTSNMLGAAGGQLLGAAGQMGGMWLANRNAMPQYPQSSYMPQPNYSNYA